MKHNHCPSNVGVKYMLQKYIYTATMMAPLVLELRKKTESKLAPISLFFKKFLLVLWKLLTFIVDLCIPAPHIMSLINNIQEDNRIIKAGNWKYIFNISNSQI